MAKDADNIYYCTKNQVRVLYVGGNMVILFLVHSMVKGLYLRLRTTHALDFWYCNVYCQYLLPAQKSARWVVCRRRNLFFFRATGTNRFNLTPKLKQPGLRKAFREFHNLPRLRYFCSNSHSSNYRKDTPTKIVSFRHFFEKKIKN